MLHSVSALAHARTGDPYKCERHIDLAEDGFQPPTADDPAWLAYFTAAKLRGDAGTALYDLSNVVGRRSDQLVDQLGSAIKTYSPERARSKAIAAARLATVLYRMAEPDKAGSSATLAIELSHTVRSAWLTVALNEMAEAAADHTSDETASTVIRTLARPRR
jgi:hypothetical protein